MRKKSDLSNNPFEGVRRPRTQTIARTVEIARLRGHKGILELYKSLQVWQVDDHRKETCENYWNCLMYACSKSWNGFTCILCDGDPNIDE